MAVFPERMRPIDTANVEGSIKTIEEYIRYMVERMEFKNSNDNKFLSENEVSASGVIKGLLELSDRVGIMEKNIEILFERLTALEKK